MKLQFLILLLLIPFSIAHLAEGQDKVVDGYLIDFGYQPSVLKEREKINLALNLVDDETKDPIDVDLVWLRISNSKETVFAGNLDMKAGNMALTYVFPYADQYEIRSSFQKNGKTIVETNFVVNVENSLNFNIIIISFIILGFVIVLHFFIIKKRIKK